MRWSWKIARVAGIDVYVHSTFPLLLVWVVISHYSRTGELAHVFDEIFFVLVVFGVVVLHELGHALTARRYGIATRDITLLPIGGVARLERMPDDPRQELLVALAGPAVNVVLAALCYAGLAVQGISPDLSATSWEGMGFVFRLFWVNVFLVVFNLLPAFPMDGGRVLRAFLAMHMDYVQATQIAAGVGQAMALLFGFFGLFVGHPLLLFIALFVWIGAAQEASMAQMKAALGGIPIQRAMITHFETLAPNEALSAAVAHMLNGFQQDFPVVEGDRVVGVLTRQNLVTALSQRGPDTPVGEVMERQFETAEPGEMLEGVFARLQNCQCHSLPVVKAGHLVGMITMENIGEFLMIQSALRTLHRRG